MVKVVDSLQSTYICNECFPFAALGMNIAETGEFMRSVFNIREKTHIMRTN